LDFVAARSSPHLIAILGPHNAGKTTLLAAWYLLMLRGKQLKDRKFSGSASFEGWESVSYWLRWSGNLGPTFPPHTTMGQGRRPGLLHLALRQTETEDLQDILFTDAPGEWFEKWAVRRDDPDAEGARWTISNASVFLFIIDSESLIGPQRGKARGVLVQMARRLRDEIVDRPVHLVWTKADVKVGSELRAALEQDLRSHLPQAQKWELSVLPREGRDTEADLLSVLEASLPFREPKKREVISLASYDTHDPFFLFRGAS
jgi:hypothetical protein